MPRPSGRAQAESIAEALDALAEQLAESGDKALQEGTSLEDFRNHALQSIHNAKPMPKPPELGLSDKERASFSVLRLFRALAFGNQESRYLKDAGFELDVCAEGTRIQQEVGVTKIHGTVIPLEVLDPRLLPHSNGNMMRAIAQKTQR